MYECMMKNLLCSAFLKFCFFILCPLFGHQTYCYRERRMKFEVFWNGIFEKKVMIAREKWQCVQTFVSMFFKEDKQGAETLAGCLNLNLKRRKQKTLAECRNLDLSKRNKVSKPWCGDQGVVTLICKRKQGVEIMVHGSG